jgi:hypothetical protein
MGLGSTIRDLEKTYSGSRIQVKGSKRHRIPDPQYCLKHNFRFLCPVLLVEEGDTTAADEERLTRNPVCFNRKHVPQSEAGLVNTWFQSFNRSKLKKESQLFQGRL